MHQQNFRCARVGALCTVVLFGAISFYGFPFEKSILMGKLNHHLPQNDSKKNEHCTLENAGW